MANGSSNVSLELGIYLWVSTVHLSEMGACACAVLGRLVDVQVAQRPLIFVAGATLNRAVESALGLQPPDTAWCGTAASRRRSMW